MGTWTTLTEAKGMRRKNWSQSEVIMISDAVRDAMWRKSRSAPRFPLLRSSTAMGSSKTDQTALERVSLIEIKCRTERRTEEEAEKDGRTGDGEQKQKPHTEMWPFRHELQKEPRGTKGNIPANRKPKAICYKSRLLARFMQVDQVPLLRANLFRNYVLRQTTAFGRQSATFLERKKSFQGIGLPSKR